MAWKTVYEILQAEFVYNDFIKAQIYVGDLYKLAGAPKIRITLGNSAPIILPQISGNANTYGEGDSWVSGPIFTNYSVFVSLAPDKGGSCIAIPPGDETTVTYSVKVEMEEIEYTHLKETVNANEHQTVGYSGIIQLQNGFILPDEAYISINDGETYLVQKGDMCNYGELNNNGYPNFTNYPFFIYYQAYEHQLCCEFPHTGTYVVEITSVNQLIPDSIDETQIIAYLMKSPQNSNWNVLSSLLGDGDWSKLKAYVETTPHNMNRQVLRALLRSESGGSAAIVGTAVVGRDTVG